ncbi:unnamed protein product [Rotaria sp. Silwood1]|nr:unnamed protein product [Rotaria sp. Silwood1]
MPSNELLNIVAAYVSIYFGLVILVGGLIGNLLNILVFLSLKTFRENSCAFYLTTMSLLNIGQLLSGVLPVEPAFLASNKFEINVARSFGSSTKGISSESSF